MLDDNRRAIDEAAALGSPCLVLVVGGLPQFSRPGSAPSKDIAGARSQVADGDRRAARPRERRRRALAIEPLHPMYAADRACVNTLGQALDICDALDPDGARRLGVVDRRLSRLVGPGSAGTDRAGRGGGASTPSTSATGWCRRATCSSTAA